MKLREVLKKIHILSNMKEGEKIYLDKECYILNKGKICGFIENENIILRPRYTKEQFIDIQYNIAFDILKSIEIIHELLSCVSTIPNIDLYDSDIVTHNNYYSDETLEHNDTYIKSVLDNRLVLIIYHQSYLHGLVTRIFDIDLANFYMTLHIFEDNKFSDTMSYYTSSGNLSKKSIMVLDKEINGKNGQSTLNTSLDMYFDNCMSYDDMIEKIKKTNYFKKIKSFKNN